MNLVMVKAGWYQVVDKDTVIHDIVNTHKAVYSHFRHIRGETIWHIGSNPKRFRSLSEALIDLKVKFDNFPGPYGVLKIMERKRELRRRNPRFER